MSEKKSAALDHEHYRNALEEYRFQVQLNWDRTKFFVFLNTSILAAAAALGPWSESHVAASLLALLFLAGTLVAYLGIRTTREGKLHHRSAIAKKTLIEDALGLVEGPPERNGDHATFALGAMARKSKIAHILDNVDGYVTDDVRQGSITGAVVLLLWAMLLLDALGLVLVANLLADCPLAFLPCDASIAPSPTATPRT